MQVLLETQLADTVVDNLQDQMSGRTAGSLATINYQLLCKEHRKDQKVASGKDVMIMPMCPADLAVVPRVSHMHFALQCRDELCCWVRIQWSHGLTTAHPAERNSTQELFDKTVNMRNLHNFMLEPSALLPLRALHCHAVRIDDLHREGSFQS